MFKPHFGLRAGWIDQKYKVTYFSSSPGTPVIDTTYKVTSSTESWAIGGRAGMDTDWKFCGGFFLFGNSSLSILYTDYDEISLNRTHLRQREGFNDEYGTYNSERELCYLRPQLDIGLGLGWSDYFCCNDWFFDLRLGYEFHTFWSQNMFPKTNDVSVDPTATGGNLYLHGLVITARLDF